VLFEWPCNLTISYASHFVPSRSEVPFSFYNLFRDRVCCSLVALSVKLVKEQTMCVKFCFKVGKAAAETHNILREAYGDLSLSQTMTYAWFKRFLKWKNFNEWQWAAWLNSNFKIRTYDCQGEKCYLWKSSTDCPRSCRRYWNIHWFMPHNFNGRFINVSGLNNFFPRLLTDDRKLQRYSNCKNLLQKANNDENLLKNFIIGDKTWVYCYDIETKQQSSHWRNPASPCPK
jgi:hypothetical protein